MMNRMRSLGRPGAGTVAPSSVRRFVQIWAWRRSLSAMNRKAAARRGSFSIDASASYSTTASCSSLRFSRLWAMFMAPR